MTVALLASGGTIACEQTPRGLEPRMTAAGLLEKITVPAGLTVEPVDYEDRLDSTDMDFSHWAGLLRRTRELLAQQDGVVITHGTDTMAYTASFLSLFLADLKKPVVLTGAQYPMVFPESDAQGNLTLALQAAQRETPGVWVAFDGKILPGCRVVKQDTVGMSAFSAPNGPGTPANGACLEAVPFDEKIRILLLKLAPGLPPSLLRPAREGIFSGVVLETYGAGGLPKTWLDEVSALTSGGVPVVLTTQCLHGSVALSRYAVGAEALRAGAVSAGDMTTEAAYAKLLWALHRTRSLPEIQGMFETSYCGEIHLEEDR